MFIQTLIAVDTQQEAYVKRGWQDEFEPTPEELLYNLPRGATEEHAKSLLEGDLVPLDGLIYQVVGVYV